jgi:hypothetical protein
MIPIDWDSRTPTATTPDFTLTLKTGVSRALQNRLTALALPVSIDTLHPNYLAGRPHSTMRDPLDKTNRIVVLTEARTIIRELETLQDQLVILDHAEYDPIPEFVTYKRLTRMGMLRIVIAWGIIPNGATAKGKRLGERLRSVPLQHVDFHVHRAARADHHAHPAHAHQRRHIRLQWGDRGAFSPLF